MGALEAVLWAKEKGIRRVHLEGDCVSVVNAIQGSKTSVKWTTNNVIQDILFILSGFDQWECSYVKKDANSIANDLAKYVKSRISSVEWSLNWPTWINTLILSDLNNVLV